MRICIIGGGIIGLFNAYYLLEQGHQITIVDQGDFTQGASIGNAGMICPSHFTPLAAPGVIRQSLKWMLDDTSPFYVKPRLDAEWIRWCLRFFKSSNQRNVDDNMGLLSALLKYSQHLYVELEDTGLQMNLKKAGIIMVCNTDHTLHEEINLAKKASLIGIHTTLLNTDEIRSINPGVQIKAVGGVHYVDDMHLTPIVLFNSLKSHLTSKGVTWISNTKIIDFGREKNRISVAKASQQEIAADTFILCGGAWSNQLTRALNLPIWIEGGKGYNITIPKASPQLSTPMILVEGRVAVTPMGTDLRLGGTMEIAGLDDSVRTSRIKGILSTIESYLPDYLLADTQKIAPWFGYRPLSSDGMPVIGKIASLENAFINTGHGMLGLSLAPASGKIMSEIISSSTQSA